MLRDLVIEESERSPFGLVAGEPEAEPATGGSMSLEDLLDEVARMADARHGPPRAPDWAVPLDQPTFDAIIAGEPGLLSD